MINQISRKIYLKVKVTRSLYKPPLNTSDFFRTSHRDLDIIFIFAQRIQLVLAIKCATNSHVQKNVHTNYFLFLHFEERCEESSWIHGHRNKKKLIWRNEYTNIYKKFLLLNDSQLSQKNVFVWKGIFFSLHCCFE